MRRLRQHEPATDHQRDADFLCRGVGADDSRQRVGIGQGDGAVAKLGGAADVFIGMAGAGEKSEIAGNGKLSEGDVAAGAHDHRGV